MCDVSVIVCTHKRSITYSKTIAVREIYERYATLYAYSIHVHTSYNVRIKQRIRRDIYVQHTSIRTRSIPYMNVCGALYLSC